MDIYYILCVLGDGCLQRDICNLALTSKQTINSALKKMEKQELLLLLRQHTANFTPPTYKRRNCVDCFAAVYGFWALVRFC